MNFKWILAASLACSPLWAQDVLTCQNGTSRDTRTVNGYDYELWSQNGTGSATLTITANSNPANGGTFDAEWSGTINVLSRAGKKFTNNETVSSVGTITIDFEATWSSSDNVKMLGIYGWGYFASGAEPSGFSDQIEYYIIQDRGSYNSATSGTNCTEKGSATIDGILYKFTECDRINQPMLTGNGNFKQYFSYPASTSSHRTSGRVTVSKHFAEWAKVGMTMNKLYEVAMKVESYTGNTGTAKGNASITKNILCIGSSCDDSESSGSSSSGVPVSSSSEKSSSSSEIAANATCSDYDPAFCGGAAFASVLGNSTSIPSSGECLYIRDFEVIQPSLGSTVSINVESNTCGDEWDDCNYNTKPATKDGGYYVYVASGSINDYENNGWEGIVGGAKPNCSNSPTAIDFAQKFRGTVSVQVLEGHELQVHSNASETLEVFDMLGNKVLSVSVPAGEKTIGLNIPSGSYLWKVRGVRAGRFTLR